jgi:chromosome segregation ATPase
VHISSLETKVSDLEQRVAEERRRVGQLQEDLRDFSAARQRVAVLEEDVVEWQQRLAEVEAAHDRAAKTKAAPVETRNVSSKNANSADAEESFRLKDLTARLESTTQNLQHVSAQLKVCQQSRDDAYTARETAEERADEQKHQTNIAREELRVAVYKMDDANAAKDRLQVLLDSKADYTYEPKP